MTDQNIALLSYEQVTTTTTPATSPAEYRLSFDAANSNKAKLELWMSLSSDAIAQVSTVTISAGTAGNDYAIELTVGSDVKTYRHKQVGTETAASIAAFLTKIIDTNPSVRATVAGAVITITSAIPGIPFEIDNTESTVTANVVVANTVANFGIPKHRKISEIDITHSINAKGFELISVSGAFFDGGVTPVSIQPFGPIAASTSPRAISTIVANQA